MAAEGDRPRYPTKTKLCSSGGEVSTTDNPRKKLKKEDYSSLTSGSTIVEVSRRVLVVLASILHLLEVEHRFRKS